jgi:hypothetical protein
MQVAPVHGVSGTQAPFTHRFDAGQSVASAHFTTVGDDAGAVQSPDLQTLPCSHCESAVQLVKQPRDVQVVVLPQTGSFAYWHATGVGGCTVRHPMLSQSVHDSALHWYLSPLPQPATNVTKPIATRCFKFAIDMQPPTILNDWCPRRREFERATVVWLPPDFKHILCRAFSPQKRRDYGECERLATLLGRIFLHAARNFMVRMQATK